MCGWCEQGEEPPEFILDVRVKAGATKVQPGIMSIQVFQWGTQIYPLMPVEFPFDMPFLQEISEYLDSLLLEGFELDRQMYARLLPNIVAYYRREHVHA